MRVQMVLMNANDEPVNDIAFDTTVRPMSGDIFFFYDESDNRIKSTVDIVVMYPSRGSKYMTDGVDVLAYCK